MQITNTYNGGNAQKFAFQSTLTNIDSVEILLNDLREQMAMSQALYSSIWIALNEAISNAIIHGNKCEPNKKVILSIETKWDNCICFTVHDEGVGFDYSNVPDPTDPQNIEKINGRGVFLIKKLSDLALYTDNGSTVNLYFDLTKPEPVNLHRTASGHH